MDHEPSAAPALNQPIFEQSLNLRHYWHVVLERRWLVVTAFISVFILCLIYLVRATPIYEAMTRLQINREEKNVLEKGVVTFDAREMDYLQTQYKNMMSRTLIESVIRDLKLGEDARYVKAPDKTVAVANDISVVPIRLSRLVDVKVEHPDAKRAAVIANRLATNFINQNKDYKLSASLGMIQSLKDEANTQKKNLEDAEKALYNYRTNRSILSFESSENLILQALKQYQSSYDQSRTEAASTQKAVERVDALLREGKPTNSIPSIAQNRDLQALYRDLALAEATFSEVQKKYRHKHPSFIAAQERASFIKNAINDQAASLIEALRNNALIAKATEERLLVLKIEQEKKQEELNKLRIDYDVLRRKAAQCDVLYQAVLGIVQERELTSRNYVSNMYVVDEAATPIRPVKPRIVLTLFLGVFGGFAVALGLAFFVNYLDDSVKSQDDVESYLRLPFLGYVPNIKTNSVVDLDLQAHSQPQSNAAEAFRTIRATISLTHKADKLRVLTITSTIPSEGKSLVASNLAIVTAQTGLKTLLIDADLRRPSVHKAYQLHSPVGLSSYLLEETNKIDDLIHKTEVPNLDVICCGAVPSTPSELIGSKRMTEFLQLLRGRYDRILLDCPPISAVSDPLIIAAMSDGIVFVTKFNQIRREHARKSVARVQNAGIHILGVVLNDIDFEGRDSYYYSYYYQNRYYSSHYKSSGGRAKKPEKQEKEVEVAKTRNGNGHGPAV